MNTKKREKLGDLSLDIAKYIITSVLILALFNRSDEWKWYDFIYPVIVVGVMIWVSLFLIDGKENENKKQ